MSTLRKSIKLLKRRIAGDIGRRGADVATFEVGVKSAPIELVVSREVNRDWTGTNRNSRITFIRNPLVKPSDRIFTMGSCFAVEIRKALTARGFDTFPKYGTIDFKPGRQLLAKLPERDNINHYNTFVVRQEFDLALGGGNYDLKDMIDLGESITGPKERALRWQDPYRKMVFAADDDSILDLSGKVTGCVRTAIEQADVYIITLGLTEVWRNNLNGLFLNQAPKSRDDRFSFVESTYEQNYDNMHRVCSLVAEHYPDKRIILTVSPVPLSRTFTGRDIVVANAESKCTLRTVAARISKEFSNVTYWPSYEIALAHDLFLEDGRHVRQDGIDLIIDQFIKVHV